MKSEIVSQEGSSKSPHVQTQFDGDALPSGIQQVFFTTVLLFWAQCILNVFFEKISYFTKLSCNLILLS